MKRPFTIQLTILISFLGVLIFACGSIIVYNYSKTTTAFMSNLDQDIERASNAIFAETENYLMPAKVSTQFIAWSTEMDNSLLDVIDKITPQAIRLLDLYPQISGFYSGDAAGNFLGIRRVEPKSTYPYGKMDPLPQAAVYEIRTINRATDRISEFQRYLDKEGHMIAVQERPLATDYFDPRHRPWYRGAEELKTSYWSDPYLFLLSKKIGVTAATPILDTTGKVLMVVSADITMDTISKDLTAHKIGKTGITFLIDENGGLIGYPDINTIHNSKENTATPTYLDTNNPVMIEAFTHFKKTNDYSFALSVNNVNYFIRLKKFGENLGKKWLIGFIVPQKELTADVDDMTQMMLIFSCLILGLSAFLIFIISRNIATPIKSASRTMTAISKFEMTEFKGTPSNFYEIDLMNDALQNMQRSLNDFSKFVPKAVVTKLIESGSGATIGGRKRNITLMFTDIQGFTSISEEMSSEKLIVHLSDYLNEMTKKIIENQGTIDKYIGDAIMTFWGAPLEDQEHPLHACKAALTCKQTLEELNKNWVLDRKPAFITRFGIHTGDAIVGNVGSEDRLNYSAFGDSVNLAARLEGINKYYGTTITISHETYKNVQHQFICRPIDVVAVKGKNEGVRIYELLEEYSMEHNKSLDIAAAQKLADLTMDAFKAYLAKDWKMATKKYQELKELNPHDKVADVFLERCQVFKKSPPPVFWNGTYVMTEK